MVRPIVIALAVVCHLAAGWDSVAHARQIVVAAAEETTNSAAGDVLPRIAEAGRAYRDAADGDGLGMRAPLNAHLARVLRDNRRRRAESALSALVIEGITRDPARPEAYYAAAAAAAPDLRTAVAARVVRAFPTFAVRFEAVRRAPTRPIARPASVSAGMASAAPLAAPGLVAPTGEVDQLAEADLAEAEAEETIPADDDNDPLEGLNRVIFFVNDTLDTYLFRPIASTYGKVMPDFGKRSLRNVVRNLNAPIVLANDLLQGELSGAGVTVGRFAVNSTVGLAGLFEVADGWGMPFHEADFGQTLHVYGIGAGPYVMLPVLGPASARHGIGQLVDSFFDPLGYFLDPPERVGVAIGKALIKREEVLEPLDELRKTSIDYYAAIRSLYFQDRAKTLRRGKPPESPELDKLFESAE